VAAWRCRGGLAGLSLALNVNGWACSVIALHVAIVPRQGGERCPYPFWRRTVPVLGCGLVSGVVLQGCGATAVVARRRLLVGDVFSSCPFIEPAPLCNKPSRLMQRLLCWIASPVFLSWSRTCVRFWLGTWRWCASSWPCHPVQVGFPMLFRTLR
jgi:hypothetical protein